MREFGTLVFASLCALIFLAAPAGAETAAP